MSSVARQQYGKERVRVMRVHRDAGAQNVFEYEAGISLEGDFDAAYLESDNSPVVPTDTMKNTLQALGYTLAPRVLEDFALAVTDHFLGKYPQITTVHLHLTQKNWSRLVIGGAPHPIAFQADGGERPFVHVRATRESRTLSAGFTDLLILKTTESGFVGYPRCEYTTLPETTDRIFATSATAEWLYGNPPAPGYDFGAARRRLMEEILRVFATEYSPSVQRTLFQMGEAALAAVPEIAEITLKLPNKHYLPVDLTRLGAGVPAQNELFLPTDEPHGQIEATIRRD